MNTIINTPPGMEIIESFDSKGNKIIDFKKIDTNTVPKNWEDFCNKCNIDDNEAYIHNESCVCQVHHTHLRRIKSDKNLISTKQKAKAMLAFIQLIRIRDYVNGDWVVDWTENGKKHIIHSFCDSIETDDTINYSYSLYFKTPEIRDQFLTNFRDLIEEAKEFI